MNWLALVTAVVGILIFDRVAALVRVTAAAARLQHELNQMLQNFAALRSSRRLEQLEALRDAVLQTRPTSVLAGTALYTVP